MSGSFVIFTFLQHKYCFTRVMGPKHAHGICVDPDQTPPRGLRREKTMSVY